MSQFIDKYYAGKRDHTFDRNWTFHRFGMGYGLGYLLVREVLFEKQLSSLSETFTPDL